MTGPYCMTTPAPGTPEKRPRPARRPCAAGGRAKNVNSTLITKDNAVFAEKLERQIAHLETALRINPDDIADLLCRMPKRRLFVFTLPTSTPRMRLMRNEKNRM